MFTKSIHTVHWSKFNWDMSFEKIIDLELLLPTVGEKYELSLDIDLRHVDSEKVHIIWKPPHSELNGWEDKRPSEILNTFVIEGSVKRCKKQGDLLEFVVSNREKLIASFESLNYSEGAPDYHSARSLDWNAAGQLQHAHVGKYIYLSGINRDKDLGVILSKFEDKLCLHYSSFAFCESPTETIITKSILTGDDRVIFERKINRSELIEDSSMNELPENRVFGAEYC